MGAAEFLAKFDSRREQIIISNKTFLWLKVHWTPSLVLVIPILFFNEILCFHNVTFQVLVPVVEPIVNAKGVEVLDDPVSTYTEKIRWYDNTIKFGFNDRGYNKYTVIKHKFA